MPVNAKCGIIITYMYVLYVYIYCNREGGDNVCMNIFYAATFVYICLTDPTLINLLGNCNHLVTDLNT